MVATPIGNLGDLSPRALSVLEAVELIAAEDTRISRRLISALDKKHMVSLHEHSEASMVDGLVERLLAGQDIALVSDAGTPLISDPGYRLVAKAHEHGIVVSPIPGPCAAIAALSCAGLPSDRFFFEGFLPSKSAARQTRLRALSSMPSTIIFYVPARDLVGVIKDMIEAYGAERLAALAREITKQHETIHRNDLQGLLDFVAKDTNQSRGEAVLVVAGHPVPEKPILPAVLAPLLKDALPPSQAARVLSSASGLTRKEAWQLITGEAEAQSGDENIDQRPSP